MNLEDENHGPRKFMGLEGFDWFVLLLVTVAFCWLAYNISKGYS